MIKNIEAIDEKIKAESVFMAKAFQGTEEVIVGQTYLVERFTTDIEYVRNKRVYKEAKKNLKIAQGMLKDNDSEGFYKQILQCVQEYLGDKFNLSSAGIIADIAKELLKPKGFELSIRESVKDFF